MTLKKNDRVLIVSHKKSSALQLVAALSGPPGRMKENLKLHPTGDRNNDHLNKC